MEKLTENLNIIGNLSNQPTENADELKRKFDEAGNIIKNYLNNIVIPKVEEIDANYASAEDVNNKISTFEEELENTLNTLQTEISKQITSANTNANSKATYGDFVVETKAIHYTRTQSQGGILNATYTKSGYKPLGIVGQYYTNLYDSWAQGAYVTSINDTSISVQGYVARGNTGGTTEGDLMLNILWVKVR